MKCPHCNETLLMSERFNIEIDYCPRCRGVWLDKGELEKMLDFAEHKHAATRLEPQRDHLDNDYELRKRNEKFYGKPHKKRGFLGDLFDFD
jgi:Zn-finger nucleic acid-binding protein